LFKWLLPYCHNLHTLIDHLPEALSEVGVNIFFQLKNLRDLSISIKRPIGLEEVKVQLLIKELT
jgi:hypothetical protein